MEEWVQFNKCATNNNDERLRTFYIEFSCGEMVDLVHFLINIP